MAWNGGPACAGIVARHGAEPAALDTELEIRMLVEKLGMYLYDILIGGVCAS